MKSIGEIAREHVRTPRRRPMTGRRWRDGVFYAIFVAAILVGIAGLLTLLIDTLIDALPWLDWQFISTYASRKPEQAGILAPLAGTAWIMVMTALFTVPVGVATAVFLEEFAGRSWYTRLIQLNISNLAGVPSIIYGLLGLSVFVYSLSMGRSIVAGALTLTLLVLPIVIIASQEAIKAVPSGYRDAAHAIGATRWQVVKSVVLPEAIPSIMSGVILALSRAIGESAPILMISAIRVPDIRTDRARRQVHGVAAPDLHLGRPAAGRVQGHRCCCDHRPAGDVAGHERAGHRHPPEVPAAE